MTPINVSAKWIANARRAAEEADQALRIDQSVVLVPDVKAQPLVDLQQWRVIRLTADADCADVLVGYDVNMGKGRVSTPIQAFDAARAEATTRSGRTYCLNEAPGYSDDGEYVFRTMFGHVLTDSNHSDISNQYWEAIRAAAPAAENGSDGNGPSLS